MRCAPLYLVCGGKPLPQSLSHVVRCIDCFPEPLWEETEECDLSYTDTVHRVRMPVSIVRVIPIDQEAAPDHDEKYGEIKPMHPADRKRMLSIKTKRYGWRCSFIHPSHVLPRSYQSNYSRPLNSRQRQKLHLDGGLASVCVSGFDAADDAAHDSGPHLECLAMNWRIRSAISSAFSSNAKCPASSR